MDHAFQYSVEVKSRFSLFLDDSLNSEDPDLLLSKIQNKRAEKSKKDKHHAVQAPVVEKVEPISKEEAKAEAQAKSSAVRIPKQSPTEATEDKHVHPSEKEAGDLNAVTRPRGRGGPRSFRGYRSFGPRPEPIEWSQEPQGDLNMDANREVPYGRGRGRGFSRGRVRGSAYTDYREYDRGGVRRGRGGYFSAPRSAPDEEASAPIAEGGDGSQPDADLADAHVEEEVNGNGAEHPEPVDEEPKSYTLEEYKAMRLSAKPALVLTTKGARKPNDGKDVFANMVAHRKLNEESDEEVEEVEKEPEEPQPFDIDVSFTDRLGDRGRGFRGYNSRGFDSSRGSSFRGRPRGNRGFRGEGRGRVSSRGMPVEHHAPPPAIYSDQDFPSLK